MRQIVLFALLVGSVALLTACGGETKQSEPTAESGQASPSEAAAPSARPASFGLCMMCHSDVRGKNGLGPSLFGVVGRTSGTAPGYSYSPAIKSAGLTWDQAHIDRFIQSPRELVPGTKMTFAGLKDPRKRAEITAYLATLN